MTTALTTVDAPQSSPMALLVGADLSAIDADKIGKLMDLQERWMAQEAEKALAAALAAFQADSPVVFKGRKSNNSTYASLDDILLDIREPLAKHGLSISFDTKTVEKNFTAVCYVMHSGGAKFSREVSVPIDINMRGANASQQAGSASTYARRYALVAALNLIVSDRDDDGGSAGSACITREQVKELEELLGYCPDGTAAGLLEWAEAEALADIPASKFEKAKKTLKSKIR